MDVIDLMLLVAIVWLLREKIQQQKDSMQPPVCPRCSSEDIKRVSRIGPERLISLFYIYPFRCQPCGHRFRLFQRGVSYTRIQLDHALDGSGNGVNPNPLLSLPFLAMTRRCCLTSIGRQSAPYLTLAGCRKIYDKVAKAWIDDHL